MYNALVPSIAFSTIVVLAVLSGSTGDAAPQGSSSLSDDGSVTPNQVPHLQKVLADHLREKRAWNDLHHSGWGKRNWGDLKSPWGKRGWQDLQSSWGKRGWGDLRGGGGGGGGWTKRDWNKFHGSWGKRDAYYPNDAYDDDDDDAGGDSDHVDNAYEDAEDAEDAFQEERVASSRWGKRAPDWSSFKGSWGKRDPAWHNLKGLWGKRGDGSNWNKLTGVWG